MKKAKKRTKKRKPLPQISVSAYESEFKPMITPTTTYANLVAGTSSFCCLGLGIRKTARVDITIAGRTSSMTVEV